MQANAPRPVRRHALVLRAHDVHLQQHGGLRQLGHGGGNGGCRLHAVAAPAAAVHLLAREQDVQRALARVLCNGGIQLRRRPHAHRRHRPRRRAAAARRAHSAAFSAARCRCCKMGRVGGEACPGRPAAPALRERGDARAGDLGVAGEAGLSEQAMEWIGTRVHCSCAVLQLLEQRVPVVQRHRNGAVLTYNKINAAMQQQTQQYKPVTFPTYKQFHVELHCGMRAVWIFNMGVSRHLTHPFTRHQLPASPPGRQAARTRH